MRNIPGAMWFKRNYYNKPKQSNSVLGVRCSTGEMDGGQSKEGPSPTSGLDCYIYNG